MGENRILEGSERTGTVVSRRVRVHREGFQHVPGAVNNCAFHAITQPRVKPEGDFLPGGCGKQKIAQVRGENGDSFAFCHLEESVAYAVCQAGVQPFTPCGAHGCGKPAEHTVFTVDGVENLHGYAQRGGDFTLVSRTNILVIFGEGKRCNTRFSAEFAQGRGWCGTVNTEPHDSGFFGAKQSEDSVRANTPNAIGEVEIVGEFCPFGFSPGDNSTRDRSGGNHSFVQAFGERWVGECPVDQDSAGTVKGFLHRCNSGVFGFSGIGRLFIVGFIRFVYIGCGNIVDPGKGNFEQVFNERLQTCRAGTLRLGDALTPVGCVERFEVLFTGCRPHPRDELFVGKRIDQPVFAALSKRAENILAASFERTQGIEPGADSTQVGVGERARSFFAVSSDKRNRRPGVEQVYGGTNTRGFEV